MKFYLSLYSQENDITNSWAKRYDAQLDGVALSLVRETFSDSFAIIFEGSPSLLGALDLDRVPYVNVRVHPMRFGSDLILSFQSNIPEIHSRLRRYNLDDAHFASEVHDLRRRMRHRAPSIDPNTLVFLGQYRHDASVISSGCFSQLHNYSKALLLLGKNRQVFHKPHPHDQYNPIINQWIHLFPHSTLLERDTYAQMAALTPHSYVTLSSGAAYEAELLGHSSTYLLERNWALGGPMHAEFAHILHEYWHPAFWLNVLAGERSDAANTFVPHRLRNAIGMAWSPLD